MTVGMIKKFEAMDDSDKINSLKELMRLGMEPLKLLYAMITLIDPVAVRIAMQKVKASD